MEVCCSWITSEVQLRRIYKVVPSIKCAIIGMFLVKFQNGQDRFEFFLKFSVSYATNFFVCSFFFSKGIQVSIETSFYRTTFSREVNRKPGKLCRLLIVIVSASLPLYFAGTSQASLPPSRGSVAVFPVEHKGTCWRKTLATHWEDGPFGQVRYKHKYRLLSSFLFPALSLLLLFLPIFFSVVFFVCFFLSFKCFV